MSDDDADDRHQATQARAALADPKNLTRVPWAVEATPSPGDPLSQRLYVTCPCGCGVRMSVTGVMFYPAIVGTSTTMSENDGLGVRWVVPDSLLPYERRDTPADAIWYVDERMPP